MAKLHERPLRKINVESSSDSRKREARIIAGDERAQRRLAWATFVRKSGLTMRKAHAALLQAMHDNEVPLPPMEPGESIEDAAPGKWCVQKWLSAAPDQITLEGLRDRPKTGRPPRYVDPRIEKVMVDEVLSGRTVVVADLHRELKRQSEALDLTPPTYELVRYRLAEVPHLVRIVARHGKRAGIADGVIHSAVPVNFPHAVWTLDELDLGVWVKAYSFKTKEIVATKVPVVLIVDGNSGVIVSYFVANPLARNVLRGVDRWDIMAALSAGFFPEFAQPACRQFAGWLPQALRYDRAKVHFDGGGRLKHTLGIDVPQLEGYAPWARGQVEQSVQMVKNASTRFKGHEASYFVAEYATKTTAGEATVAAGTMGRVTVKSAIAIDQLYNIEQLMEQLDGVVREINEEREHSEWHMPRAARYREQLQPELLRSGSDAISFLEMKRIRVKKDGIVLSDVAFSPIISGLELHVGEHVDVRIDPALRGIFVTNRESDARYLCLPKRQAANLINAAEFAHTVANSVSMIERLSKAVRQQFRDVAIGPGGSEVADAIAKRKLDGNKAVKALHRPDNDPERKRTQRSMARTAARPVAVPTGVVPITQAPSHGRPATGPAAATPFVRRGIIRSFI